MAHEIMGKRFIARSQPAWHNIAQRIFGAGDVITARQAMAEVAQDIKVDKFPLYYSDSFGASVKVEDRLAVVRQATADDPRHRLLGITSDAWELTTYPELAGALDPLSAKFKVETAGVLKNGGLAFLCFRGEDYDVRGDAMRTYFAANFSLTPGEGHRVFHSPVRVVCWNTNTMAQGQATINLGVPHTKDALQRIELAARLATQFHEMKDKAKGIFEAFADTQVTRKDVDAIIYAAFQLPTLPSKLRLLKQTLSAVEAEAFKGALTPTMLIDLQKEQEKYERQCEQTSLLRQAALESFERFNPPNLRGTAWAAYNAVTEVADWREGRGADESAVVGSRAQEKSRAFEAAMALVR